MIMKKLLVFVVPILFPIQIFAIQHNIFVSQENSIIGDLISYPMEIDSAIPVSRKDTLVARNQKESTEKIQDEVANCSMKEHLKNFYREYCNAILIDSVYFSDRADSLVAKHCTKEFYEKVKDEFITGVGYDFMTADYGITNESFDKISIVELDSSSYKVQYQTEGVDVSMKPIIVTAKFIVKLKGSLIEDVVRIEE